ncbi:MAG: glycosyltransferase [Gemmatimonadales bacterium]|nr:MAG: glycosyltransferase [Gemmatimonadales bacterium]
MSAAPWIAWTILGVTAGLLALLIPLAVHRLVLLRHATRRGGPPRPGGTGAAPDGVHATGLPTGMPCITVQLPVFNEAEVVERLVAAVAALEYPREQLEIQILDDSTDETTRRIQALLPGLARRGIQVSHLCRENREGFKAGALAEGLRVARGEFLLILDADFVPRPDLLRALLPSFEDPGVGMVQARWDHLNEGARLLTRAQALLLDGHFYFEQAGRHAAGRFLNFNGTAGMWRRSALEDAGGWSADTLTEDLDVSYRAQMAGWRFVYRGDVGVPAELPEGARALEVQQRRWAQGGIETGRKLLPALWRGPWSPGVKSEATFHLLGHLAHPLTVVLGVLLLPSALARQALGLEAWILVDLLVFAAATGSFLLFYVAAARMRRRPWPRALPQAALALVLGVGLTAPVTGAVLRGLSGRGRRRDTFHRTPKGGAAGLRRYRSPRARGSLLAKSVLAGWMGLSILVAVQLGLYPTLPFLVLFGAGWGWLAVSQFVEEGGGPERGDVGSSSPSPQGMRLGMRGGLPGGEVAGA